jgi:hypothetical protein
MAGESARVEKSWALVARPVEAEVGEAVIPLIIRPGAIGSGAKLY